MNAREYLTRAENDDRIPEARTADALTGLLTLLIEHEQQESREGFLQGKWDERGVALGRVLALADDLDAHPHATLKPTAFRDLAALIRAAVHGESA